MCMNNQIKNDLTVQHNLMSEMLDNINKQIELSTLSKNILKTAQNIPKNLPNQINGNVVLTDHRKD